MNVIIIEGLDNTGKGTLIQGLMGKYDRILYLHCQKPKSKDPIKAAIEQEKSYRDMISMIEPEYDNGAQAIIFDRSWIGEYVYGCLYRGNGDEYVSEMITSLDKQIIEIQKRNNWCINVNYFYLSPDYAHLDMCIKNDDGKSLSARTIDNIRIEHRRFIQAFKYLDECKYTNILVNKKGTDEFRDKEDILNEVMTYMKHNGTE